MDTRQTWLARSFELTIPMRVEQPASCKRGETMTRRLIVTLVLLLDLCVAASAAAQSGDGSLRGLVKDEQGAVMPGVTVTAASLELLTPAGATTEADGSYRLSNLPPGTYALTAELSGFRSVRKEGILLRAGANFQVDFRLTVGSLEAPVTV